MSGFFGQDGPLMRFFSKMFDVMLLNILWLVGCLPVITAGAATTAMYAVLMKLVRGESYTVLKVFWQSFKSNFKQATLIWLILLAAVIVLSADLYYFFWIVESSDFRGIILGISILFAVLTLCVFVYVFPLQACFHNTVKQTLKNALLFSLSNLFRTLMILAVDAAIIIFSFKTAQILALFTGGLVGFANASYLKRILEKYLEPEENEPAEISA